MDKISKTILKKQGITVSYRQSHKIINGIKVYVENFSDEDINDEAWLWYTWEAFTAIEWVIKIHNRFPAVGETLSIFLDDTDRFLIETIEHHVSVIKPKPKYSMTFCLKTV